MADLWTTRTRIFADKVTRTRFDKKKLIELLILTPSPLSTPTTTLRGFLWKTPFEEFVRNFFFKQI